MDSEVDIVADVVMQLAESDVEGMFLSYFQERISRSYTCASSETSADHHAASVDPIEMWSEGVSPNPKCRRYSRLAARLPF
jgi:hypothetical protein